MFHLWCICQFHGLNSESEVKGSESICMMILLVGDFNVNLSVLFFLFFGMLRVYTFNGDTKVIIYWRKDSSQGLVACKLLLPLRKKKSPGDKWGEVWKGTLAGTQLEMCPQEEVVHAHRYGSERTAPVGDLWWDRDTPKERWPTQRDCGL